MCLANVRGGKRKLVSTQENSAAVEVAENSGKSEEGKATEAKRPKRQAAAADKAKVVAVILLHCFCFAGKECRSSGL